MSQTEQQQADLAKIDEMVFSLDADVEKAREELPKAAPARRLELNEWLRVAKLGKDDLETTRRIVERTEIPFSELKPPRSTIGSRKQRDAAIRQQYLAWEGKRSERERKAFEQHRQQILDDIQSGKVDPAELNQYQRHETPAQVVAKEVAENKGRILQEMADEEREYAETHGGRQKRWPGGKGLAALKRGFGMHPSRYAAEQSRRLAMADAAEERRLSHKSEAALRLEAADKIARQRKGQK